jgi:hypothetical protein
MEEIEEDPYNLINYDLVIIILKDVPASIEKYKEILKIDKKKNKYFIKGKLIQIKNHYPKYKTLAFINEKDITSFKQVKLFNDKQKFVFNIHLSDVDSILVQIDNLDWKK